MNYTTDFKSIRSGPGSAVQRYALMRYTLHRIPDTSRCQYR